MVQIDIAVHGLQAGTTPDRAIRIPVSDFYGKTKGNLTGIMLGQHSPVWSILLTSRKTTGRAGDFAPRVKIASNQRQLIAQKKKMSRESLLSKIIGHSQSSTHEFFR
jgi:hypothetical protein